MPTKKQPKAKLEPKQKVPLKRVSIRCFDRVTSVMMPVSAIDEFYNKVGAMPIGEFLRLAFLDALIKYGDKPTREMAEEVMRKIRRYSNMAKTRAKWSEKFYIINQVERNIIPLMVKIFFANGRKLEKSFFEQQWESVDLYLNDMGKDWLVANKSIIMAAYKFRKFDVFMDFLEYLEKVRDTMDNGAFRDIYRNMDMHIHTYVPEDKRKVVSIEDVMKSVRLICTVQGAK
jgi:hypothetical protein